MEFRYYTHHPMVDYANSMDPEMYGHDLKEKPSLSIKDIGMSVPMGISAQNVAGIYSKIRMGVGSIEIGFPGVYSGQRQAQTPEMYGEDQRQAIRELANINEIKLTTHAAYNVMGLMGHDQRDNFSMSNATQNLHEIQRAIDFAADTAGGGSVVVHTGEWERPLTDITIDDPSMNKNYSYDEETGRLLFRKRHMEAHDAGFVLLDDRTSQKMETVQKDRLVSVPKWIRAAKDNPEHANLVGKKAHYQDRCNPKFRHLAGKETTIKEGDYLDYEGNIIINPYDAKYGRVPEFDEEARRFKVEYKNFDQFKEEAKEQTEWNKHHWKELYGKEWYGDDWFYYKGVIHPDEAFIHATLETNEGHSRGWAGQYASSAKQEFELLEKLKKAREFYENLDKEIPEEDKWKIMKQDSSGFSDIIPPETKHPLKIIDERIKDMKSRIEFSRQSSASQEQQAEDTAETKGHIVTPTKRFKLHVARLYAEAGMRAWERTKDPDNPVFLALENIFPERFGGHPEELKFIIDESRKWLVRFLTEPKILHGVMTKDMTPEETGGKTENPYYKPNISKEQAEKIAEQHIKATWDTGHANMWRKFWQIKPGQTIEHADEDFKKWYLSEFEKLAKGGYIGNIHLTDNLGFQDDHIAPGQGNAPIKEVMDILKKHGYDKAITVEPGADASTDLSDFHGLMKTWRYLGSPIYGIGFGAPRAPQTWGNVQYSYFGQTQPPYYIFGAYAPSNDWTLWSQVPLE